MSAYPLVKQFNKYLASNIHIILSNMFSIIKVKKMNEIKSNKSEQRFLGIFY